MSLDRLSLQKTAGNPQSSATESFSTTETSVPHGLVQSALGTASKGTVEAAAALTFDATLIGQLPDELIFQVASFLGPCQVSELGRVCKRLYSVTHDVSLLVNRTYASGVQFRDTRVLADFLFYLRLQHSLGDARFVAALLDKVRLANPDFFRSPMIRMVLSPILGEGQEAHEMRSPFTLALREGEEVRLSPRLSQVFLERDSRVDNRILNAMSPEQMFGLLEPLGISKQMVFSSQMSRTKEIAFLFSLLPKEDREKLSAYWSSPFRDIFAVCREFCSGRREAEMDQLFYHTLSDLCDVFGSGQGTTFRFTLKGHLYKIVNENYEAIRHSPTPERVVLDLVRGAFNTDTSLRVLLFSTAREMIPAEVYSPEQIVMLQNAYAQDEYPRNISQKDAEKELKQEFLFSVFFHEDDGSFRRNFLQCLLLAAGILTVVDE